MPDAGSKDAPSPHALRVSGLSADGTAFNLRPDGQAMSAIADSLGLEGLRKLRFDGDVRPAGREDWVLTGRLGATVEQICDITLQPVRTRIDCDVMRRFSNLYEMPELTEAEMPADDSLEPLGLWIDPEATMIEALSLEIPAYPRADGAQFDGAQFAKAGTVPLTDEDVKPFASLAELREKLRDADS